MSKKMMTAREVKSGDESLQAEGRITSRIKTFKYENGAIQRVQVVKFDDFNDLRFLKPKYDSKSFEQLCSLYRDYIIKRYAAVFGKIVIFKLPGNSKQPLAVVNKYFKEHIRYGNGGLIFSEPAVKEYFEKLKEEGCLYVAEGRRKKVSFLPVGREMGFLSKNEKDAALRVNSSFFIMDQLDCGSYYDHVGIPLGLMIEDGHILNPPQFDREAFIVCKDGKSTVSKISLKDITVEIDGIKYVHGQNATFYERPYYAKTPKGGVDLVILNNKLVDINVGGKSQVPSGGFVIKVASAEMVTAAASMSCEETVDEADLYLLNKPIDVTYSGLENISFAIQVGNSVVVEGKATEKFVSPFYNFLKFWKVSYPPTFYPLNFKKARAPRIVLGADSQGHGMLLWYEGAGKFGYVKGQGSCGASLSEAADIAVRLGMVNGIHLDGGGSAQIIIDGKRELQISDRNPENFSERERAIPVGLMIK